MKHEPAMKALSEPSAKNKGKKKVVGAHVKRAKGGYIVHHEHEEMGAGEDHVVPDMASLQAHMAQHLGDEPEAKDNKSEEKAEG